MTATAVAVALILDRGRCFVQRRDPAARSFPGLWEFPGGKLEPGETPRAALLRELLEELRWRPDRAEPLPPQEHAYPDFAVILHPFRCTGAEPPRTGLAWGWFARSQLDRLPMPEASRRLLGWIP
ncbi:MAG: NUDIX domain-containing protein [Holophaga sp.]|nr:NUDIX domain-containing protein [Holophaga sp.]